MIWVVAPYAYMVLLGAHYMQGTTIGSYEYARSELGSRTYSLFDNVVVQ